LFAYASLPEIVLRFELFCVSLLCIVRLRLCMGIYTSLRRHVNRESNMKRLMAVTFLVVLQLFSSVECNAQQHVLVGDSMMYGFDNFLYMLPSDTLNLGLTMSASSYIADVAGKAAASKPKAIFIETGVNDIGKNLFEQFSANYDQALQTIQDVSPQTKVYANAIIPSNFVEFPKSYDFTNSTVKTYNQEISRIVSMHPNATYLDFTPQFSDALGNLKKDLSFDGLHLNRAGYELWSALLKPYF